MENKIIVNIMGHLSVFESALRSSHRISAYALTEDLELLNAEIENRSRIMNIINNLQNLIENEIDSTEETTPELVEIVKAWANEVELLSQAILDVDNQTSEQLELQKENTQKELSTIYRAKSAMTGYNSSSVKK